MAVQLFELPRSLSTQLLLLDVLNLLQSLRTAVTIVYLEDSDKDAAYALQAQVHAARDFVKRVCDVLGSTIDCPTIEHLQQQRREQIECEIDCAQTLCEREFDTNHHIAAPSSIDAVCTLIQRLRGLEESQEFHRSLLQTQRAIAATSDYTVDNFAYGSTPFPTWLAIVSLKSVRTAIAAIRLSCECANDNSTNQRQCTVFGSSTGSLVFYAALALGVDCVGVEILPFLSDVATQLRDEVVPVTARSRCAFMCSDMLQTPLTTTNLLVLTSQCWDNDLHDRVVCKLERELPGGAVVVDYKDSLGRSPSFQLVERLDGLPVSWTRKQPLYVFRKSS